MAHYDDYVTKLNNTPGLSNHEKSVRQKANIEFLLKSLTKLMQIMPKYIHEGSITAEHFISPIHWEDKIVYVDTPTI
jgi:hypothetical protein